MSHTQYDAVVIGGGFIGCCLALYLKEYMDDVLILERESDVLQRASYANQARVHNGYHYPRSFLTALRSRQNFKRFVDEYQEAIDQSFAKYYAIGKLFSNVTARQFVTFCKRIGAPIEPASTDVKKLFNRDLIEDVFLVKECAFDAVKLKNKLLADLVRKQIELKLNSVVAKIAPTAEATLEVFVQNGKGSTQITARRVFNCTYSHINQILAASNLPLVPLKHELAEIALVDVVPQLKTAGITVMDGPFFSIMPFPPLGLHAMSHVRYTPHHWWQDSDGVTYMDAYDYLDRVPRASNYVHMIKDAQRYLLMLRDCRYVDSLWEVKTVLPSSEVDDSRPILFLKDYGMKGLTCILGGKIDNIFDVLAEMENLRTRGELQ